MFRLIYEHERMTKPEWVDSDNIEHLREVRETMLGWANGNEVKWKQHPFIRDISQDGWIRRNDGTLAYLETK